MTGIKMAYSWGEDEPIVECTSEDSWETMFKLAMEEARVDTCENENDVILHLYRDSCEIDLHYLSDDEHCYYSFVDDDEGEE